MGLVKQCLPAHGVEMGRHFVEQQDGAREVRQGREARPLAFGEPCPLGQDDVEQKRLLLAGRTVGGRAVFLAMNDDEVGAVRPEQRAPGGGVPVARAAESVDERAFVRRDVYERLKALEESRPDATSLSSVTEQAQE